jgi:SAM-dependent methyltransferase
MFCYLTLTLSPRPIRAADLHADARDILASHADPSRFEPDRSFDMIRIASLSSHPSKPRFQAWLGRLISLLKPDGILCFGARDPWQLPPATRRPASGFLHARRRENVGFDGEIRGAAKSTRNLSAPGSFRRGPWSWLDRAHLPDSGELHLQGWVPSLDDGEIDLVEIEIDSVRNRIQTSIKRADVAATFDDERMVLAGREFRCDPGLAVEPGKQVISAHSKRGETALPHLGFAGEIASTD